MSGLIGVAVAILVGIVLLAAASSEGERLTRRAWTRLFILGATGLSLLPGCLVSRGPAPGDDGTETDDKAEDDPLLARWAKLGRVWRELNAQIGAKGSIRRRRREFDRLEGEMVEALDALPAWPELRAMFEERAEAINDEIGMQEAAARGITCYEVAFDAGAMVQSDVSAQVRELEALVEAGKLSKEAAGKAAAALAVQAEVTRQSAEAEQLSGEEKWTAQPQLWEDYRQGRIEAGPKAELAGKRLAELTVDDLGLLAGPPQDNEGMPLEGKEPDNPQEDAEQ